MMPHRFAVGEGITVTWRAELLLFDPRQPDHKQNQHRQAGEEHDKHVALQHGPCHQ